MIIDFSNINGGGGGYVLPIASDTTLGGIKVGSGLTINSGGTLSADAQPVGIATTASTGVVQIGSGLSITSGGVLSADAQPVDIATTAQTGIVKIGSGVNVDAEGTISVSPTDELSPKRVDQITNNKFALSTSLREENVTRTNYGFVYDLGYLNDAYTGTVLTYNCYVANFADKLQFTFNILNNGNLEFVLKNQNGWAVLGQTTATTFGTYTIASAETYGVTINYSQDNKLTVTYNGAVSSAGFGWGDMYAPVWKQNNNIYKLKQRFPIATTGNTGMVKIGSGINIDAEGTISVTGGTGGGGIEVVTELPSSGTDGQMVLLETILQEMTLIVSSPTGSSNNMSVTGIGLTNDITVYNYEWFGERDYVTLKTDHSVSIYSSYDESTTEIPADGEAHIFYMKNGMRGANVTFTVTSTGFTTSQSESITKENVISNIIQKNEEKQVLYTWSDAPLLTSDIDYTSSSGNPWCVMFRYSSIPNNTTLVVWKYAYGEDYRHLVYEDNALHIYASSSADTYTATTYVNVAQYGFITERYGRVYWTEDEIVVFSTDAANRVKINENAFYQIGWHKNLEHYINGKAMYKDYVWYDKDYQIIIKHPDYPMYNVGFKINPTSQYSTPAEVYSKNNSTIGPFFAPTTTGSTGQVCIAGNGWAAPTWTNPENLTNGVKFWKGTLDEYEAIGEGNYDANTLYICTDE